MHHTDIVIIGAGPVGLFTVFQAGMLNMTSHIIDVLPHIGGQCSALYPEKPIYDIPAYANISAQSLIDNLSLQNKPFSPTYHLNQQVSHISGDAQTGFTVTTHTGTHIHAKVIIIAAGAGAFTPNRPPIRDIISYENQSVFYAVTQKSLMVDKNIVIAGGGDSAVDWALELYPIAKRIAFVHRRDVFKASDYNIAQLRILAQDNKIDWYVPSQLCGLTGENGQISQVLVKNDTGDIMPIDADILLPFYGLSASLGDIKNWGLHFDKNHISTEQSTGRTNINGIYAVGDVATYPHKLKLILTGFAETASAVHDAYHIVFPDKALHFEYSTSKRNALPL